MLFKKMQNTAAKKKLFWFSMLCCKLYFFFNDAEYLTSQDGSFGDLLFL